MSSRIVAVVVPKWGLEMTEGTVSSWLKQPGDVVARGEPLIEVESEKIVNSLDAPAEGMLRRILLDAGNIAAVGTLIGVLPGVGPIATIAMLLPATYALPPLAALISPSRPLGSPPVKAPGS